MNPIRSFLSSGLIAVVSAWTLVACGPSIGPVIKIGVAQPLSGSSAARGQDLVNGVKLAVSEINASGYKVAGKAVQFEVLDLVLFLRQRLRAARWALAAAGAFRQLVASAAAVCRVNGALARRQAQHEATAAAVARLAAHAAAVALRRSAAPAPGPGPRRPRARRGRAGGRRARRCARAAPRARRGRGRRRAARPAATAPACALGMQRRSRRRHSGARSPAGCAARGAAAARRRARPARPAPSAARRRARRLLGSQREQIDRASPALERCCASSRLASSTSSTSASSSPMLVSISRLEPLALRAGRRVFEHRHRHLQPRQRRAQFVAGVGQQRLVRAHQRLDALRGLVEAGGHRGHLVAAGRVHALVERAGAEALDAVLQRSAGASGAAPPDRRPPPRPRTAAAAPPPARRPAARPAAAGTPAGPPRPSGPRACAGRRGASGPASARA